MIWIPCLSIEPLRLRLTLNAIDSRSNNTIQPKAWPLFMLLSDGLGGRTPWEGVERSEVFEGEWEIGRKMINICSKAPHLS